MWSNSERILTISKQTRAPVTVFRTPAPMGREIMGDGNEVAAGLVLGSDISGSLSGSLSLPHSLSRTPLNKDWELHGEFLRSHVSPPPPPPPPPPRKQVGQVQVPLPWKPVVRSRT